MFVVLWFAQFMKGPRLFGGFDSQEQASAFVGRVGGLFKPADILILEVKDAEAFARSLHSTE